MRGTFQRNQVEIDYGYWAAVLREQKLEAGGNIMILEDWGHYSTDFHVYWRKTRNVRRYQNAHWSESLIRLKSDLTKEEAIEYFEGPAQLYNPGPNATKRRKRKEVRDSQRKRVYAWERSLFSVSSFSSTEKHPLNERMSRKEVKALYHRVFEGYGIPENKRPELKFRSCYGSSSFNYGWRGEKIKFSTGGCKPWVVLHEIAHCLSHREHGDYNNIAGHGPEFVGWYVELLIEFGEQDMNFLRKSLRDFEYKTKKRTMRGVKYASPNTNTFSQKEAA